MLRWTLRTVPTATCTAPRRGESGSTRLCARLLAPRDPPDWATIAARLDSLGAWTIADRCEPPGNYVMDAGELLVQRLDGARFDTYGCNAPALRRGSAAGERARALDHYIRELARRASSTPQ